MMTDKPVSHDKRKNAPSPLHALFDFTDEDLAENALWHLSPRQQRRLQRTGIVYKYSGYLFVYVYQSGRSGPFYRFTIQKQEFGISKKEILAFKNGAAYNLYVERDTRTILSMQETGPASAAISAKTLYDALDMKADDLPANREGRLSQSQRRRLLWEGMMYLFLALVCSLMLGVLVLLLSMGISPWLILALSPVLLAGSYLMVLIIETRRDKVLAREGLPIREVREYGWDRVIIKGNTFKVSTNAILTFNPDIVHRVYYTPITKTLVAAEQIESAT